MGKRTLGKVATPQQSKSKRTSKGQDVPSVSAMTALSAGGSEKKYKIGNDSIQIHVLKFASDASAYGENFGEEALYALHLCCDAQPNPFYQFKTLVTTYAASGDAPEGTPAKIEDAEQEFRMSFQYVGKNFQDLDSIGFVKYRCGVYIAKDMMKDFFMYLDDLMAWRKHYTDEMFDKIPYDMKICVHCPEDLGLTIDSETDETKVTFEVDANVAPEVSIYDLPPPVFPPRLVIMTFEYQADFTHVIFSGNTKPFQPGFVALKIKGQSFKSTPEQQYGEYFRVIQDLSITDTMKAVKFLEEILGEKCLKHSPVVFKLKPSENDRTNINAVLESFRTCPNVRMDV